MSRSCLAGWATWPLVLGLAFAGCREGDRQDPGPGYDPGEGPAGRPDPHLGPRVAPGPGTGAQPSTGMEAGSAPGPGRSAPEVRAVESAMLEPITHFEHEYEIELARTTAGAEVPALWLEATPTAAPAAPAPQAQAAAGPDAGSAPAPVGDTGRPRPTLSWQLPAVVVGRKHVFAAGKPIDRVRCSGEPGTCEADALRGPTGKQRFDLDPARVDGQGHYQPLAAVAGPWRDQDVYVLPDRRIAWSAVERILATLTAAGARPVLVGASFAGKPVRVQPAPGSAVAPVPGPAAAPVAGESAEGGLPDDLSAVLVRVTTQGMSLELQRGAGVEPARPELLGAVAEALGAWAEKIHDAKPAVTSATVEIEPAAPVEEVVRAVDGLRDNCARMPRGTPCHERRQWFRAIELRSGPEAAPPTVPAPPVEKPRETVPAGR